jgi:hypothetical protein
LRIGLRDFWILLGPILAAAEEFAFHGICGNRVAAKGMKREREGERSRRLAGEEVLSTRG